MSCWLTEGMNSLKDEVEDEFLTHIIYPCGKRKLALRIRLRGPHLAHRLWLENGMDRKQITPWTQKARIIDIGRTVVIDRVAERRTIQEGHKDQQASKLRESTPDAVVIREGH